MKLWSPIAICSLLAITMLSAVPHVASAEHFDAVWETQPPNSTFGSWRPSITAAGAGGLVAVPHGAAIEARRLESGELAWSQPVGTSVRVATFHDGRLYVGGIVDRTGSEPLPDFAVFDAESGALEWSAACGGVFQAPVVHADGLVVASTHALVAMDATGGLRWSHAYPRDPSGFPGGPGTSGAVRAGDAIIAATADGFVHAYRLADGTERWRADVGGRLQAPPALAGPLVVCAIGARLVALATLDGSIAWTVPLPGDPGVAATVAIGERLIVVAGAAARAVCVDAGSGALLWSTRLPAPAYAAPEPDGERVLVADAAGALLALDLESGGIAWRETLAADRLMDPVTHGDYLAVAAGNGTFAVFRAVASGPAPALAPRLFPNPTRGAFALDGSYDRVRLFDAAGRLRRSERAVGPGVWEAVDQHGRPLAAGTYLVELTAAGRTTTVKLSVLR